MLSYKQELDKLTKRDTLITEHLCLVRAVAAGLKKRLPAFIDLDDLISAGNEGLIAAASAFDPAVGVKFSLFAKTRIYGAMIDYLRSADPIKRSTRTWQKRIRRIEASLSRSASDEELASEFHCTVARARKIRADASVTLLSLDAPKHPQISGPHNIACPRPSAFDVVASGELAEVVKTAVALLSPRYQYVVEMYYCQSVPIRQIARQLGLSEGRVSQIRASALNELESILQGLGIEYPTEVACRALPERKSRTAGASRRPQQSREVENLSAGPSCEHGRTERLVLTDPAAESDRIVP